MNCLVINGGVVGLLTALMLYKAYGGAIKLKLIDACAEANPGIIRLGSSALNFIVRDLGINLAELMTGQSPGVFYLGLGLKPGNEHDAAVISHQPTRALVGAMPVDYAISRLRRVGGSEKLEHYSLAAQLIGANAMALPNKKGECPLGDDEIGISISLHHLRNLLVARLVQAGIILSNTHVLSCEPADQSMVVRFADSSLVAFDWVINTTPNQKVFSQVPWQQVVQWKSNDTPPLPSAQVLFESRGWHIRESLAQNVRLESRNIGWRELGGVQSEDDVPEPMRVNKTSAWFGAVWQNRMLYLTDFDYWGAEFLLDPLQPAVRIIRLINELTPVQGSVDLLARYFNERSSEISCACRAFVVAHLMQSSVAGVESIICEADKVEFKRRRELYLATGEASQPSATLIAEGVWAAFWHAWSVYPRTVSSLLRPVELAEVVGQLRDIKANIAEIIPRLPRHQYYISLINGGEA